MRSCHLGDRSQALSMAESCLYLPHTLSLSLDLSSSLVTGCTMCKKARGHNEKAEVSGFKAFTSEFEKPFSAWRSWPVEAYNRLRS